MAIFKTLMHFFKEGTPNPATEIDQLLDEVRKNNDFKKGDLEKEVIEINSVLNYQNHPIRPGFLTAQMNKRAVEVEPAYPGFSFHSKHFINLDQRNDLLALFESEVIILTKIAGKKEKKKIKASKITEAYTATAAENRMITYTSDHSI